MWPLAPEVSWLATVTPVSDDFDDDLQQSEQLLNEVDRVLRSLDDGTFGTCHSCGAAIEPSRLLADPLIATCEAHPQLSEQDQSSEPTATAEQE